MREEKGITDSRIDYEPKGCISAGAAAPIVLYVVAAAFLIVGIIFYFAVMPEIAVFGVFVLFAVLSGLCGLAVAKRIWYWGEEKVTVMMLFSKPVTFSYSDIENIYTVTEGPAVTLMLRLRNGKQYGISMNANGTKEFVEHLNAIHDQYPD